MTGLPANAMKTLITTDPVRYRRMNAAELRESFLLDLFAPEKIQLVYTDANRAIVGSAAPGDVPLEFSASSELRAEFFCERRELGVLNIGQAGEVTVDGRLYPMDTLDGLYIERGCRGIRFGNPAGGQGAEFYLLSYPAHLRLHHWHHPHRGRWLGGTINEQLSAPTIAFTTIEPILVESSRWRHVFVTAQRSVLLGRMAAAPQGKHGARRSPSTSATVQGASVVARTAVKFSSRKTKSRA